jgi:hypothetical protein
MFMSITNPTDEELISLTMFPRVDDFVYEVFFKAGRGKNRWWLGQDSRGE